MCGVAGVVALKNKITIRNKHLEEMTGMLAHRGPDGQGIYLDEHVGLAHTRLSIIDLEGGSQPIHNEDESIWIIFNGEIFNYLELKAALIKDGHRFYTATDTEVIVHLYEEYGKDFVDHLNGQFAIVLWDKKNTECILVRDRVGILPLFYTICKDQLFFGSEVKAILSVLPTAPSLNAAALDQLMTFWSPVTPNTIFKDIYEISPGEMLTIKNGDIQKQFYWDWQFPKDNEYLEGPENRLQEQLFELLVDATQLRLRSDVPVGAYLSGGLDSSAIVALIHHHTDTSLRTFSISFENKSFDESQYQARMINAVGADHSTIKCTDEEIGNQFLETIWHTEVPILRTAPVPMRMLSGLVREQGYKVVLTGEGSDEVLGGYDIFKEAKIRQFWAKNTASGFRPLLLKRLYPYLEVSPGRAQAYLQNFFGIGLDNPSAAFFSHLPRWVTTAKTKNFFSATLKDALTEEAETVLGKNMPDSLSAWHYFNRAQYIEAKTLMAGYLLCSQGDRMLMSNSVEGRFPFLDHRLIEFANRLHPDVKMKVLNEKYLLKCAMKKYIPVEILQRHKQPYRAPDIPAFFCANSPDYVDYLLSEDVIERYGYFDQKKVGMLLRKVKAGRAIGYKDNTALVGILSTQAWHFLFVEEFTKRKSPGTKAG